MTTATRKSGTHLPVGTDEVTWRRLVLVPDGIKLVEQSYPFLGALPDVMPRWDYVNTDAVTRYLPASGMMIVKINLPFNMLNELPDEQAWRMRHLRRNGTNVSRVVIHGAYDPSSKDTVTSTIDFKYEGATVHIISEDYGRSIGDFLVDNAGFQTPDDFKHERLNDAVICHFGEVLMVTDNNGPMQPAFSPHTISYETLDDSAAATTTSD